MNLDELMRRDLRTHLEVAGVIVCGADADGLERTTEALWSTCAACLAAPATPAVAVRRLRAA